LWTTVLARLCVLVWCFHGHGRDWLSALFRGRLSKRPRIMPTFALIFKNVIKSAYLINSQQLVATDLDCCGLIQSIGAFTRCAVAGADRRFGSPPEAVPSGSTSDADRREEASGSRLRAPGFGPQAAPGAAPALPAPPALSTLIDKIRGTNRGRRDRSSQPVRHQAQGTFQTAARISTPRVAR
jgi:hypothetical protein